MQLSDTLQTCIDQEKLLHIQDGRELCLRLTLDGGVIIILQYANEKIRAMDYVKLKNILEV